MGTPDYINQIYHLNAKELSKRIKDDSINLIITSPPYFNLKDYGYDDQIGYGQNYLDYLEDVVKVFSSLYDKTAPDGSLWIIIDTFKNNGELIPLPFQLAERLQEEKWKFKDILIWKKDKTLPWTNGKFRKIFEYILIFSKNDDFKYYSQNSRMCDIDRLKKWWLDYPERYSPLGKSLDGIWEYEIPVQGAWSNGELRHFCPFPDDLVKTIIDLTTNNDDCVCDPFAGSGSVLINAKRMSRNFIGSELNLDYVENIKNKLNNTEPEIDQFHIKQNTYSSIIWNLRAMKYAKLIFKEIDEMFPKLFDYIVVNNMNITLQNDYLVMEYSIIINKQKLKEYNLELYDIESVVTNIVDKPTLKNFKILSNFIFKTEFHISINEYLYGYSASNYKRSIPSTSSKAKILSYVDVQKIIEPHNNC